jgi:hypothetical protein
MASVRARAQHLVYKESLVRVVREQNYALLRLLYNILKTYESTCYFAQGCKSLIQYSYSTCKLHTHTKR